MVLIVIDTVATLIFGVMYARRVRYRPIKPTYIEVIIGVGFSLISSSILSLGIHLEHITFNLLRVNIIIWLPMTLTGVLMAYHQICKTQEQQAEKQQFLAGEHVNKGKVAISGRPGSRRRPDDDAGRAG